MDLGHILDMMDEAPRRIEIEQTWKNHHYDRGYQFLLHNRRNGGWQLPGTNSGWDAKSQQMNVSRYHTNIYAEKNDIVVSALSNEVPEVEFFPINPKHAPDVEMADAAEDVKDIWAKNNNLQQISRDAARIMCISDRVLCVTRYELNGQKWGWEQDDQPLVPETEEKPPTEPIDTEGGEQYEMANESPVPQAVRRPRGRVVTLCLDKLSHQVPISVDEQGQMVGLTYVIDGDIALLKARYPWCAKDIQGGGDGTGTTEFARIARENVAQNIPGTYVTGDSLNRHTSEKFQYIRKEMFSDATIKPDVKSELVAKFPDGALMVKVGTEFVFARNENIDDCCKIVHPTSSRGQNRRPLMESLIPIQDYLNELFCLALDFAKRTVPKKWMNSNAFKMDAVKASGNIPGTIGSFLPQAGLTSADQYIMVEPTPQPQPWLIQFIQWIITALSEQISGAMPSLFGKAITGQVGSEGVALQRDSALQRMSSPWSALQDMFACAAQQAVVLTARCSREDIEDVIPGKGPVSVKINNLKGNVLCYPESNPSFPESWDKKETRIMDIIDKIASLPEGNALGEMFFNPENLDEIRSVVRIPKFVVEGAISVAKQHAEFEVLLRTAPIANPKKIKGQKLLDESTQGMVQHLQQGQQMPPEAIPAMNQLEQQVKAMPDLVSFVPVREDASENHVIEAKVCFDWMNDVDGRKYSNGSPQQMQAFQNVYLHWEDHTRVAAQLAAQNAPKQQPKVAFSVNANKLPPAEQAEVVEAGGIPAQPKDFSDQATVDLNHKVAAKVIPDTILTSQQHHGEQPQQQPKGQPGQ
jgi:hypothetical protein